MTPNAYGAGISGNAMSPAYINSPAYLQTPQYQQFSSKTPLYSGPASSYYAQTPADGANSPAYSPTTDLRRPGSAGSAAYSPSNAISPGTRNSPAYTPY